jgi:hypothetical protein
MARHEVNPIEDWESEELSEEELDLLAGGFSKPFNPTDFTGSEFKPLDVSNPNFSGGEVVLPQVPANKDSSYSSFLGATGTTLPSHNGGKPMNLIGLLP